jgi:E3 ubiquitin-protein ligase RGLG
VSEAKSYHILVIIADGQVDAVKETSQAIVEATNYPLSIICIGVGDGPWGTMEEFDQQLPKRRFDNFRFVPYYETMQRAENREVTFALAALQEIPEQYKLIKKLELLS